MSSTVVDAPVPGAAADIAGLEPLETIKSRWPVVIGALLTVAMIVQLARELLGSGLRGLEHAVPHNPLFYIAFALLYMSPQLGDFVIYRRLWGLPVTGLAALLKKRISNDVVFGYSGEAYFYAWARQHASLVAAPFGAVKDVTILSAIAGNAITLLMVVLALPFAYHLLTPQQAEVAKWSIVVVIAMSLPFLIFSKRVFSLDRGLLWWIFGVHCGRLISGSLLIALCWHYGLPGFGFGVWLILSALRMIVGRLPLVPNKDLLFATLAIPLLGQGTALSSLVALVSALTLVVHVVLIGCFSVDALVRKRI